MNDGKYNRKNEEIKKKKKNSIYSWKISEEQLNNQIDNYHKLSFFESYRKIAVLVVLFLIASILITVYFYFVEDVIIAAFPMLLFYLLLLYFIYKGHRWAIIILMVAFTIEMIFKEIEGLEVFNRIRFYPIIWWLIVTPIFYKALKVENEIRRRKEKMSKPNPKNFIFCQSCGQKNIIDAGYCYKCGSKIIK